MGSRQYCSPQRTRDSAPFSCRSHNNVNGVTWITPNEDHVSSRDGHIRTGSDGDPQVGRGQGWGIVHAVAGHRDDPALTLKCADLFTLLLGKNFGDHFIEAQVLSHPVGHFLLVAGQDDHLDPALMQDLHGPFRFGANRVG
jgi:hypothetical protein